eukprot:IDg6378t1
MDSVILGDLELLVAWQSGCCSRCRSWSYSVPLGLRCAARHSRDTECAASPGGSGIVHDVPNGRSTVEQALWAAKVVSTRTVMSNADEDNVAVTSDRGEFHWTQILKDFQPRSRPLGQ